MILLVLVGFAQVNNNFFTSHPLIWPFSGVYIEKFIWWQITNKEYDGQHLIIHWMVVADLSWVSDDNFSIV